MEEIMSLYETFYEPCRIMNKVKIRDPEGGIINTWTEGEEIQVAFQGLTPTEKIAAQQATVQYTDTITTPKGTALDAQDVFRRGTKYYLVVSVESATPKVASFDFEQYNVRELVKLP